MDGIISRNESGGLDFGGFAFEKKQKQDGFSAGGNVYKIKTHNEITRLEKNDALVFETTPGSLITDFYINDALCAFDARGLGDTHITVELLPETQYRLVEDDVNISDCKTNKSGKIMFSAELSDRKKGFKIEKI